MIRLVIAEARQFPELAAMYRRIVIEPIMAAIRLLAARAVAAGEMRTDALARFPHLLAGPVVVPVLWNALIAPDAPVDPEALFEAWLDLAFPPPPPKG